MSRSSRSVSVSSARMARDSSRVNDDADSLGSQNEDAMAQMQEQVRILQEQMRKIMTSSSKEVESMKAAHEVESKHAADLQEELQLKLEESERKRIAAEKTAAAGVGGARVVIHEELSVRREDYQAMLRDLSKIKKDGSNYESWRKQFQSVVYVTKWDPLLFDLDAHPWNGREEADEVIRSHRVAAYMCLMRCISPELDYLSAGVKIGDARALYKKIHVRFAKATEEKLREANNSFSRSELRQKPTWDVSQYAGEVVKAAQKISEFGGQEPTEAQQRAALLEVCFQSLMNL